MSAGDGCVGGWVGVIAGVPAHRLESFLEWCDGGRYGVDGRRGCRSALVRRGCKTIGIL